MNTSSFQSSEPIHPHVRNEFGSLKTVVLSPMSNLEAQTIAFGGTLEEAREILLSPDAPPDMGAHLLYRELLERYGASVIHPHHPNLPLTEDTIAEWVGRDLYCRDFLGAVDDHAILTNIWNFRRDARMYYQRIFERVPKEKRTTLDETFSWGNALLVGDHIVVGHEHNDFYGDIQNQVTPERFMEILRGGSEKASGIRAMEQILRTIGTTRQLTVLATNMNADLDCYLAPLPRLRHTDPRRAIMNPNGFHPASEDALYTLFDELIPYKDTYDDLGLNLLWINPEIPVVPTEAKNTIRQLRELGYNPIPRSLAPVHINANTQNGEHEVGGWRCMTGVLERANDYNFG